MQPGATGEWSWTRGRYGDLTRTLVAGRYLLDVVEVGGAEARTLESWHLDGSVEVLTPGGWSADRLDDPFVDQVERFTGATDAGVLLRVRADEGATLTVCLKFEGDCSAQHPPGRGARGGRPAILVRTRSARIVAALETRARRRRSGR